MNRTTFSLLVALAIGYIIASSSTSNSPLAGPVGGLIDAQGEKVALRTLGIESADAKELGANLKRINKASKAFREGGLSDAAEAFRADEPDASKSATARPAPPAGDEESDADAYRIDACTGTQCTPYMVTRAPTPSNIGYAAWLRLHVGERITIRSVTYFKSGKVVKYDPPLTFIVKPFDKNELAQAIAREYGVISNTAPRLATTCACGCNGQCGGRCGCPDCTCVPLARGSSEGVMVVRRGPFRRMMRRAAHPLRGWGHGGCSSCG